MFGPSPASTFDPTCGAYPAHPVPLTCPPSQRSDGGREIDGENKTGDLDGEREEER